MNSKNNKSKENAEEYNSTASQVIIYVNRRLRFVTFLFVLSMLFNFYSAYDSIKVRDDNFNKNKELIEVNKQELEKNKQEIIEKIEKVCGE